MISSYAKSKPVPKTILDLHGWDVIQLSALRPQLALVPPRRSTPQLLDFVPRVAVDSATAMRAMTIAGLGISSLPHMFVRTDLSRGRLVEVLPAWRLTAMGVYAVWPGGTTRPALTLRFVEFMADRLSAFDRWPDHQTQSSCSRESGPEG